MPGDIRVLGDQRQLFPKHQFIVKIHQGGISAGFQKCSELSSEVAKIEYHEGGSQIPWKIPGRVTMTDITLERGASSSSLFYDWMISVANASVNVQTGAQPTTRGWGQITPYYMRDLTIIQLDRDGLIANSPRKWFCKNAWVQKFTAGDWDNTADEVVIEALTLTFDWFRIAA